MKTFLAFFLGALAVTGCVSESHISGNSDFPTDYVKGTVYVLQKDTYGLIRRVEYTNYVTALELRPDRPLHDGSSFADFAQVPAGTRLVVDDVLRFYTFEQGTKILVQATFLSGQYKGKIAVVDRISNAKRIGTPPGYWLLIRNPEFLEVEGPNHFPQLPLRAAD